MRTVLVLLLFCSFSSAQDFDKPPQLSKNQIWGLAKEGVKQYLKSPSSASFGGILGEIQDPEKAVLHLTDDTWGVTGWVDAINSFGANLRQNFYCELKLVGKSMQVEYIELDGKKLAGSSVLPKLAEKLKRIEEDLENAKIDRMVKTRITYGGRTYLKLVKDAEPIPMEIFARQIAIRFDIPKFSAWIYHEDGKQVGILSFVNRKATYTVAPFKYPDPFLPDGYFSFREWVSESGTHKLKAKYSGHDSKNVRLETEDGKTKEVPIAKLGKEDQEWIRAAPEILPR